jgi:hypothetical protein
MLTQETSNFFPFGLALLWSSQRFFVGSGLTMTATVLAGGQVIIVVGGDPPVPLLQGEVETGGGLDPPPDPEQLPPEPAGLAAAQLQRAAAAG